MAESTKSGQELLDAFFADVASIDGVDQTTAEVVGDLYEAGKLTPTNIANELSSAREVGDGHKAEEG